MKKLFLGICFFAFVPLVKGQVHFNGKITDVETGAPISSSTVHVFDREAGISNDDGLFDLILTKGGIRRVHVSHVGYNAVDTTIDVDKAPVHISLKRLDLFMQPIEVRALRAGDKAPFTRTDMSKKEIEKNNLGQDMPFILNQTPSVVVNSDAGNGVGYTGIYIRGTDATRINMTLNGIPYNDAESQGIYFVDLPDFASSVNSIRIQRGVGTSSNGAGAFGATMNFSTNEVNVNPYAEINNSYGSFNIWKNTIKAGSGLIGDHFTIDARLSRI